jgi:hypothetical protein
MNNQERLFIVKQAMVKAIARGAPKTVPIGSKMVTKTMQGIRKGDDSIARNLVSRYENNPEGHLGPMGLINLNKIKGYSFGLPVNTGKSPTQYNKLGYENLRKLIETIVNNKIL